MSTIMRMKKILATRKKRFTVKSRTSIDEFADYFNMEILQDDYETVGGLVTKLLGHVPAKGEEVKYEGLTFKVLRQTSVDLIC